MTNSSRRNNRGRDGNNRRILIVDDQREIHDDFADMLGGATELATDRFAEAFDLDAQSRGEEDRSVFRFDLSHALSGEDACEVTASACEEGQPFALAFVDIRMAPGIDGIETIRRMRTMDRDMEVVIMTAYSDRSLPSIVRDTELLHKTLYLRKPFSRDEIRQIAVCLVGKWNVGHALARRSREVAASKRKLEAVLNATGDALVMYDQSGRVTFANHGFQDLCGLPEEALDAAPPGEVEKQLKERLREPDVESLSKGYVVKDARRLVERIGPKGDRPELFYRAGTVVRDGTGDRIGELVVYRNVSNDIEVQRMKAEVTRLRGELEGAYSFGEIVGGSRRIRQVYGLIRQAADSNVTVLVRGETGTGKELVARSFHENSGRRSQPFVAISCAAIPGGLIESELFGHEKGAFTGATHARNGAFARADGGTLFLDEIADMQIDLQAKLLRVLQEGEFQRLGGEVPRRVDVRIIAATNKDLEAAVMEGSFREDLFYRLSVYPVHLPPLRSRREDIPLLARHFLKIARERTETRVDGFSGAAMRLLLAYSWPGNVRELSNVIERSVLLETTSVLQAGSLPRRLSAHLDADAVESARAARRTVRPLARVERRALVDALRLSGDNIAAAARALGISRSTLYRKLRKHGLRPEA